jgi:hypothetical protein
MRSMLRSLPAVWAALSLACATVEEPVEEPVHAPSEPHTSQARDPQASRPQYRSYEAPPHAVLVSDGPLELRAVDPYLVARTDVEVTDFDDASTEGFRRLARYIFGGNEGKRDVAMTVPVTAARTSGESIAMTVPVSTARAGTSWRISFMMPSGYTLASLPTPKDERVVFEEVPARMLAVVRFSWLTTQARMDDHTESLRRWVEARGLRAVGDPVVARYDDPFTLPWNRQNEIWLEVAER